MQDHDHGNPGDEKQQRLARIATLQRLREDARAGNRAAMLNSLEKLIEVEAAALRKLRETESARTER